MNIWHSDPHYAIYLDRISRIFDGRVWVIPSGKPGNHIVMAFESIPSELNVKALRVRARALEKSYPIEFLTFFHALCVHNHQSFTSLSFEP
jgi:spermidine synthase